MNLPVQTRFAETDRIAYFTMEIAVAPDVPTYSGGLGILAGDTIRAAADLELPVVAVSLVSRNGYFRQTLDPEGWQSEAPDPWDPAASLQRLGAKVVVPIEGREVWVGAWLYTVAGHISGHAPVILLDTELPENQGADRELTHQLYGGDTDYRFKQEVGNGNTFRFDRHTARGISPPLFFAERFVDRRHPDTLGCRAFQRQRY
jgi:starch phosphorylase